MKTHLRISRNGHRFAVPFEEDERDPKTWFLDLDYIESMWEMFRKVNGEHYWAETRTDLY